MQQQARYDRRAPRVVAPAPKRPLRVPVMVLGAAAVMAALLVGQYLVVHL